MKRKSILKSVLSICLIMTMMLCTVFAANATVHAEEEAEDTRIDLGMGGSQFSLVEKHAYWKGGLHMSEFPIGTDDPVIGIFDMETHNFTPLKEGTDYDVLTISRYYKEIEYDVTNRFNKNEPGDYSYIIEGKGAKYKGRAYVDRFIMYDPNPAPPQGTTIKKVSKLKKGFKVYWNKSNAGDVSGYQIRYSLKPSMAKAKKVTELGRTTPSTKVTKLKSKKKYYIQVRTCWYYRGKYYYSAWSPKKSIKTK